MSPHSDIDLLFLWSKRTPDVQALKALLYPLWDAGWTVGHSVRTPKEAITFSEGDVSAATSVLSARLVFGNTDLFEELVGRRSRWMDRRRRSLVRRIIEARADRAGRVERAGWALAPDLKDDLGGLRDAHTIGWLDAFAPQDVPDIEPAADVLLAVREALHGHVRHRSDRVRIDLQPLLAEQLGMEGEGAADSLMAQVHTAARAIEHATEDAIEIARDEVLGGPRRSGSTRRLGPGVRLEDGVIELDAGSAGVDDALRVAAAHAETGRPVSRRTRLLIEPTFSSESSRPRWDESHRALFLQILRSEYAAAGLELLDRLGTWESLLPEWLAVRGLPQHDPYHRLTVDGHSFTTVSQVTRLRTESALVRKLCDEAGNLDALYLAALLHDAGKGSSEDHSVAGERIARQICERIGLERGDSADVAALVRLHLLLPDTATRRDLDDGSVIGFVAKTVENDRRLRLLYVLAMADGRATGPRAWNEWKAALVHDLFTKTVVALETGELPMRSDVVARARELEAFEPALAGRARDVLQQLPPSYLASTNVADMADELRLLIAPPGPGEVRCHTGAGAEPGRAVVTLCVPDRPGTLARGAGVLALHRISVLSARAYVTSGGLALTRFLVEQDDDRSLDALERSFEAAFSGRLALEARLLDKIRDYRSGQPVRADVRVLNDASPSSTVVEVRAPDTLGLLYALAAGLADVDLDIHVAKIDTLGDRVVDVFYVRTLQHAKLNTCQFDEVRRAIAYRVDRLLNG